MSFNGTPAQYLLAAPTLISGQDTQLYTDSSANLLVSLATTISGEDLVNDVLKVEKRFSYTGITGQATTVIKSGSGLLSAITINTPVATSVITIYDNTAASGTKIATITLPATLLQQGPYTAVYNVSFTTGLTIVTGTASSDITVSWR